MWTDRLRASAVSSAVMPPKNRISMILAKDSSTRAKASRALSSSSRFSRSTDTSSLGTHPGCQRYSFGNAVLAGAPLLCSANFCIIDEHLPHNTRGYSQKVHSSAELPVRSFEQFQIGFVHEGGGLQCVVESFPQKVPLGDSMQLLI